MDQAQAVALIGASRRAGILTDLHCQKIARWMMTEKGQATLKYLGCKTNRDPGKGCAQVDVGGEVMEDDGRVAMSGDTSSSKEGVGDRESPPPAHH